MDAYDIQQALRVFWGKLAVPMSGSDIKKSFPTVPVYVKIGDKLSPITDISLDGNKIILDVETK